MGTSVSIVVPVYRSADIIGQLVTRIESALRGTYPDLELILVNDASQDDSWAVITEEAASRDWVRGIDLTRNFGQHNALLCGIRQARRPVIVTMDDDLQHPPEAVPALLARLDEGYDVVYGTPEQEQHGIRRDVSSLLVKETMRAAMGIDIARDVCAFRAFRCELRDAFADYSAPSVSIDVLLSWATTRFTAVPVRHEPRTIGTSNYTFGSLVRHTLNMMTGFSLVPLRVATLTGFAFSFVGLALLMYVSLRYLFQGNPVPGFPFLASIIAVFSGVQLFALGVIGEYLGRMHFRVMGRPAYAVRTTTSAFPSTTETS